MAGGLCSIHIYTCMQREAAILRCTQSERSSVLAVMCFWGINNGSSVSPSDQAVLGTAVHSTLNCSGGQNGFADQRKCLSCCTTVQ